MDLPLPPDELGVSIPSLEERASAIDGLPSAFRDIEKKLEKDGALPKIRNYRNKYAAHPILATREERSKKTSLDHPTVGEVRELLSSAASIMRDPQTAALGYTYDYSILQERSMFALIRFYSGLRFSSALSDARLAEEPTERNIPTGTKLQDL
ncbi:hypothetical protein AB4Y85_16150 [Microvirga sp. 2YAF29]|uniref:AbiU2 domain-containing protein n=1 Tax=Microvirga sp. 2YAF29 TaxID=3233031 RepID=UPI003F9D0895